MCTRTLLILFLSILLHSDAYAAFPVKCSQQAESHVDELRISKQILRLDRRIAGHKLQSHDALDDPDRKKYWLYAAGAALVIGIVCQATDLVPLLIPGSFLSAALLITWFTKRKEPVHSRGLAKSYKDHSNASVKSFILIMIALASVGLFHLIGSTAYWIFAFLFLESIIFLPLLALGFGIYALINKSPRRGFAIASLAILIAGIFALFIFKPI